MIVAKLVEIQVSSQQTIQVLISQSTGYGPSFAVMEKDSRRHVVWCLDGKNFASWKYGMKLALQSDELWEVVDGTQHQHDMRCLSVAW